eukprot:Nk52_evm26s294 gene=Nk52_evmTU26s294
MSTRVLLSGSTLAGLFILCGFLFFPGLDGKQAASSYGGHMKGGGGLWEGEPGSNAGASNYNGNGVRGGGAMSMKAPMSVNAAVLSRKGSGGGGGFKYPKCDHSVEYWSNSCGAIASSTSKACSLGGTLVYAKSCNTHFEPYSRGCSFLYMGCRSKCRISAPECNRGTVGFVEEMGEIDIGALISNGNRMVQGDLGAVGVLFVKRFDSWDKGIQGKVRIVDSLGETVHESKTIHWKNGERHIESVRIPISVLTSLSLPAIAEMVEPYENLTNENTKQVKIVADASRMHEVEGTIGFSSKVYSADEGVELAILKLVWKPLPGLSVSAPSAPVHVTVRLSSGTAVEGLDFESKDRTVVFDAGKVKKEFSVGILFDREDEQEEKFYAYISKVNGGAITEPDYSFTTVSVSNSNSVRPLTIDDKVPRLLQLRWFQEFPFDPHTQLQFLNAFTYRFVKKETVIFETGDLPNCLYVIEEGICSVLVDSSSETQLARVDAGDSFGGFGVLHASRRRASVMAKTDVSVWVIDKDNFRKYGLANDAIRREVRLMFVRNILKMQKLKPPILLYPGFASSKLVAWAYKWCRGADIEVGENVWLSIGKVMQTVSTDAKCWLECLSLGQNQTDPASCKLRASQGISAVSELSPGLFTTGPSTIFGRVINTMAMDFKFDSNSIVAFPYDWRLSPDHLEKRDSFFSRMKARIEEVVQYNRHPAIALAHSQGNNILLYFLDWMKLKYPDSYKKWSKEHLWCYVGFGAPLLGSLDGVKAHANGITMGLPITELQARDMAVTFGSINWFTPLHFKSGKTNANLKLSWPENLVHIKIDSFEKNFTAKEVNDGTFLKVVSEHIDDPNFKHLHRYHLENYLEADINPLDPPKRPPIKHIYQLYGINLETDVSLGFGYDPLTNTLKLDRTLTETKDGILQLLKPGMVMPQVLNATAGTLGHGRSGDKTVPYVSLAWAHTWHGGTVKENKVEPNLIQYYRNPIGKWGEENLWNFMSTVDPAHSTFESSHQDDEDEPQHTTVIEIEGIDHRNIVKDDFTLKKLKDIIIGIVENEYHLANSPFFYRVLNNSNPLPDGE